MKKLTVAIIAVITTLFGAFGGFLTKFAPPEDAGSKGIHIAVGVASFFTLALFLLVLAISHITSQPRRPLLWILIGIAALIGSIPALVLYVGDQEFVAAYPPRAVDSTRYIKGTEYTEPAQSRHDDLLPSTTDDFLMLEFAGDPQKVWTSASIAKVRRELTAEYVLLVVSLMLAIMCFANAAAET